ncbi:Oligopeptidase A [Mannheimia haemolytica]|uniref:Oligopeptidase A n=1 Tax=Mannheimia haemolytica TaxID=75985 RepID=A0A378MYX6_MANHA|nr:Oligopeptidase A [Mannheimia haemolytica]
MTYCENKALREEMYRAYVTRASDQGPNAGKWDNSAVIDEILKLRHEKAQLLGFKTYSDYSLATKMAENPQQVLDFLNDLAARSKAQGKNELCDLKKFAKAHFGIEHLDLWIFRSTAKNKNRHCIRSMMKNFARISRKIAYYQAYLK